MVSLFYLLSSGYIDELQFIVFCTFHSGKPAMISPLLLKVRHCVYVYSHMCKGVHIYVQGAGQGTEVNIRSLLLSQLY